jgi:hypothetical protein
METTETLEATAIFSRYLYRRYGDRSTAKHYLSGLLAWTMCYNPPG